MLQNPILSLKPYLGYLFRGMDKKHRDAASFRLRFLRPHVPGYEGRPPVRGVLQKEQCLFARDSQEGYGRPMMWLSTVFELFFVDSHMKL
jgi:hypothetical protein